MKTEILTELPMPIAWEPDQISATFASAFNSGKIENLVALYEENPTLIAVGSPSENRHPDGTAKDWIAELTALIGVGGQIECHCRYALRHGDVALVSADWRVSGLRDIQGNAQPDLTGRSAEIVRQQPDGRWLYLVDHPTGA